jgi:hypothetical protein
LSCQEKQSTSLSLIIIIIIIIIIIVGVVIFNIIMGFIITIFGGFVRGRLSYTRERRRVGCKGRYCLWNAMVAWVEWAAKTT